MKLVLFFSLILSTSSVFSREKDSCDLYIPNVVTMNCSQAGSDYLFRAVSTCKPFSFEIVIFNRWGELLFETKDMEEYWDASKEKDGVYIYKLSLIWKEGEEEIEKTGHLTVLK